MPPCRNLRLAHLIAPCKVKKVALITGETVKHPLLAKKAGSDALVETFYPQLHELGWEGAFLGLGPEEQVAWFPWFRWGTDSLALDA